MILRSNTKVCTSCKKVLALTHFTSSRHNKLGLKPLCGLCSNKQKHADPVRSWAQATLNKHKARGCNITVTIDDIVQLSRVTKTCYLCNCVLTYQRVKGNPLKATLDRLDNEKSITKNNIAIVCMRCNTTKLNRTLKDFIEYCALIATRFKTHSCICDLTQMNVAAQTPARKNITAEMFAS